MDKDQYFDIFVIMMLKIIIYQGMLNHLELIF